MSCVSIKWMQENTIYAYKFISIAHEICLFIEQKYKVRLLFKSWRFLEKKVSNCNVLELKPANVSVFFYNLDNCLQLARKGMCDFLFK